MRLLFVTCHLPYPPHSGGRLREHQLLARLTQRFDVHVAAITKTLEADREAAASVPWQHDGISLFEAAQELAPDDVAPQVARHRSREAARGIPRLIRSGSFDVVHVEGFYLWQHVANVDRPPTVLVEQNIEWQLYEQRGIFRDARATRRAEIAAWRAADALGALTDEDAEVIAAHAGSRPFLVPDGADHLDLSRTRRSRSRGGARLLMVGNFGYEPNVDGARWLVDEVLPLIRASVPDVRLDLVGASPRPEIQALAGDAVEVTGRVDDVRPYLERADVVVCPLRFGGGVKVKVLEALAAGKAIVTTSVGCQGLGASRTAVSCNDTSHDFAAATIKLLTDVNARARAEQAASGTQLPSWDDAADALAECWRHAARRSLAAA